MFAVNLNKGRIKTLSFSNLSLIMSPILHQGFIDVLELNWFTWSISLKHESLPRIPISRKNVILKPSFSKKSFIKHNIGVSNCITKEKLYLKPFKWFWRCFKLSCDISFAVDIIHCDRDHSYSWIIYEFLNLFFNSLWVHNIIIVHYCHIISLSFHVSFVPYSYISQMRKL